MFPDRSPDPSTDPDRLIWRAMPVPDWLEPRAPPTFEYRMTLYYRILYDDAQKLARAAGTRDLAHVGAALVFADMADRR